MEPSLRPPAVSTWFELFGDRTLVRNRVIEVTALGQLNKAQVGDKNDPILPAIQAQRLFLLVAFTAFAYVVTNFMSFPGAVLGMSAAAVGITVINPSIITEVLLLLGLIALSLAVFRLLKQHSKEMSPQTGAETGTTYGSMFSALVRVAVVVLVAHLFSATILRNSFLSGEQQYLLSETLAMSWNLLFAASALWFIRRRQGMALVYAGIFAGLGYLTRSASFFLLFAFGVLLLVTLFCHSRKLIGFALGSLAVTTLIVYAVPISWLVRGEGTAPTAPMLNWGPIAFAIELAQSGDEHWLPDYQSRQFFAKALSVRDHPGAGREAAPSYRSANLGANLYRVAIPVAKEILPHAFSGNIDEPLIYTSPKDIDDLFGKVARPILKHRAIEYANMVGEAAAVATGIHPTTRSTRLFQSPWHWFALAILLTLAFRGSERDIDVGFAAALLIGMHVVHVSVVSAFDIPLIRYVYATEIFVVLAIMLLLDYHVRMILKGALRNWRMIGVDNEKCGLAEGAGWRTHKNDAANRESVKEKRRWQRHS